MTTSEIVKLIDPKTKALIGWVGLVELMAAAPVFAVVAIFYGTAIGLAVLAAMFAVPYAIFWKTVADIRFRVETEREIAVFFGPMYAWLEEERRKADAARVARSNGSSQPS